MKQYNKKTKSAYIYTELTVIPPFMNFWFKVAEEYVCITSFTAF
jgi:hypothetical protein